MLWLMVAIPTVTAAAVLALMLRGRLSLPGMSLVWISAVAALAGVTLLVFASGRVEEIGAVRTWPTAQGTIVDSHITQDREYNPDVRYRYTVEGVAYEGETKFDAPGFGSKRKRYDVALEVTEEHPVGSSLVVHYDPENPAVSTPVTHVSWATYTKLSFGAILLASGIFTGTLTLLGRFRR